MANNPVRPAKITDRKQFQTSEDDRIPWNKEDKMATYFYNLDRVPQKSWDTSGDLCYGDARLGILAGDEAYKKPERN